MLPGGVCSRWVSHVAAFTNYIGKFLQGLGYTVPGTGNAPRTDYATTVVMYRPGFRGEATRLARDLRIAVVGPLDGMRKSALHGAQLTLLLGAR